MARGLVYYATAAAFGPVWLVTLALWPGTAELLQPHFLLTGAGTAWLLPPFVLASVLVATGLKCARWRLSGIGMFGAVITGLWAGAALVPPIDLLVGIARG